MNKRNEFIGQANISRSSTVGLSEEAKESDIPSSIHELGYAIQELEISLGKLISRIQPVSRSEPVCETPMDNVSNGKCELSSIIRQSVMRIDSLKYDINLAIDMLEI